MITTQTDNRSTKLGAEIVLTIIGLIASCVVVLELNGTISLWTLVEKLSYFADEGALTAAVMVVGFGLILPTMGFSIRRHGRREDAALPWIIAGLMGMVAGLFLSVWGGSPWYTLSSIDLFYAVWATGALLLTVGPLLAILGLLARWIGRSDWVQKSIEYDRQQKEARMNSFREKFMQRSDTQVATANDAHLYRQTR